MTLDEILEKLEDVHASGNGYVALCPAHEDTTPSLGIAEGENEILLQCYAGCPTERVIKELGVEMSDLFFGERAKRGRNHGEPEAVYPYTDEYNNVLFEAVRFPGKVFKQRHHDPDHEQADEHGYVWNLQDVRRVLFHLPRVQEAKANDRAIYVVEGEKDVLAIEATGNYATCNPMGAGKWRDEYTDTLAGAKVVIVADRDEPGRNHADKVKQSLMGRAADIWVVQAKVGKDVSDHLAAGLTMNDLQIRRTRARKGIVTASELARAGMEELDSKAEDIPGFQFSPIFPFTFKPGRVYAIGAYTSDGKTRFGLQGFRELAQAGVNVGYFSLEMPERDLRNILTAHRGVPLRLTEVPSRLRESPGDMALYRSALNEIGEWNADIVFESGMNAEKIIEYTRDREYDCIVVDHLHRFSWGGERRAFEEQVQKLTNLALDANVCVVLMCQLRRQTRGKDMEVFPEPTLSDFRESGVIEQESSMAISIWRQRVDGVKFSPTPPKLTILKNRHRTGYDDAAGVAWYPKFDADRELFLVAGGGMYESGIEANEPAQAADDERWD